MLSCYPFLSRPCYVVILLLSLSLPIACTCIWLTGSVFKQILAFLEDAYIHSRTHKLDSSDAKCMGWLGLILKRALQATVYQHFSFYGSSIREWNKRAVRGVLDLSLTLMMFPVRPYNGPLIAFAEKGDVLTFPFVLARGCGSNHYANPTIIYPRLFMGLTQVMLQVKGCEMVCKQRELIPGLRRWSQALNRERVAVFTLVRAQKIATDGFSRPVCCLA